jgi:glycosyltransferase involved in cell wall biosynthesis
VRHVAHITSVHRLDDTRIFVKECRSLRDAGYQVTLLGFNRGCPEPEDGIRVIALSPPSSRIRRIVVGLPKLYRVARKLDAEIFHLHDPELLPVGALLALGGSQVIYDVHDSYRDYALDGALWLPGWSRRLVSLAVATCERLAARLFTAIVAATPRIATLFPAKKTVIVQNYPVLGELDAQTEASRPPHFALVGSMSLNRGSLDSLLDAISLIPEHHNVRLLLAGSIHPPELLARLQEKPGWSRTEYLGYLTRTQVGQLLARVRAGIVLYRPERNSVESQPQKLYEYFSVGIPALASNFPAWRRLIEGEGIGLCVDPICSLAIARGLQRFLDEPEATAAMGAKARRLVERTMNWQTEAKVLCVLYHGILRE